jgi:probable phosphoglycerate mutase
MTTPLQIYLIRHGETEWTLTGQHTGSTDLPLTPHGEAMARQLARTLAGTGFALVLSSPLQRAQATCELAGLGTQMQTDDQLTEWDYGDYEGLKTSAIELLYPGWGLWEDGCPGGESPTDAEHRADQVIARLSHLSGKVALFSHGQFGRALAARWIGLPVVQGGHFALDPASISILGFEPAHRQRRVISLWNAAATGSLHEA